MRVGLLTAMRDAVPVMGRWFEQVEGLRAALAGRGDGLTVVVVEGDSADGSRELLRRLAGGVRWEGGDRVEVVEFDHGGPKFGSVVSRERFRQLAGVGNRLLEALPGDVDVVVVAECDLVWGAGDVLRLVDQLPRGRAAAARMILGPLVMHGTREATATGAFYDTWAFRACGGRRFGREWPWWPDGDGEMGAALVRGKEAVEVESVGSLWVMGAGLARRVQFWEEDAVVGLCRQARVQWGARVWVVPGVVVMHPW